MKHEKHMMAGMPPKGMEKKKMPMKPMGMKNGGPVKGSMKTPKGKTC